ncbi:hypothetical protein HDU97_008909 [Phlyctochytrium planicorne]|nr:hypothetical protein HDU97_008909 [Phlyctochytrium planicorne]
MSIAHGLTGQTLSASFTTPSQTPPTDHTQQQMLAMMQAMVIANPALLSQLNSAAQDPITKISQLPPAIHIPKIGKVVPSSANVDTSGNYTLVYGLTDPIHAIPEFDGALEGLVVSYVRLVEEVRKLVGADDKAEMQRILVQELTLAIELDKKALVDLIAQEAKEAKDVKKMEGFSFKSMKAKMSGKFDDAKQKELQEFERVKEARMSKERAIADNTRLLSVATSELDTLNSTAATLLRYRKELINTINKAFETSTNPSSTHLSTQLDQGKLLIRQIFIDVKAFQAAKELMEDAKKAVRHALFYLKEAIGSGQWNVFNGNSISEINMIRMSEECAKSTESAVMELKKICDIVPAVQKMLSSINIQTPNATLAYMTQSLGINLMNLEMLRRNETVLNRTQQELEAIDGWLDKCVASMKVALVSIKEQVGRTRKALTVYRMGCLEVTAIHKGVLTRRMLGEEECDAVLPKNGVVDGAAVGGQISMV